MTRKINYQDFQSKLGYTFNDPQHLMNALWHPSAKSTNKQFERLEFLGDRVLGLVMAQWLLETFPAENEGSLAKRQAVLVSRESCQTAAETIGLISAMAIIVDAGADSNEGAIMADGMESLLGAMYLDGGLAPCNALIRQLWETRILHASQPPKDPKSMLQEWLQKRGKPAPTYTLVSTQGPAHLPELVYQIVLDDGASFKGIGRSRRLAEKAAAESALDYLKNK